MYSQLLPLMQMPEAYQPNIHPFWDDDHISAQMLNAHLNPDQEAASRTFAFMDASADWIARVAPPNEYPRLLDLKETFDLVTLIYCDFGVLNPADRRQVLRRAHAHLRPGGRMILDTFAPAHEAAFQPYQYWNHCPQGGFWRREPCHGSLRSIPRQKNQPRAKRAEPGGQRLSPWDNSPEFR